MELRECTCGLVPRVECLGVDSYQARCSGGGDCGRESVRRKTAREAVEAWNSDMQAIQGNAKNLDAAFFLLQSLYAVLRHDRGYSGDFQGLVMEVGSYLLANHLIPK